MRHALYGFCRAQDDEFRVYTEHPRLILTAQRLRLLKRERERESQRWRQFDVLLKGPNLPEPGFALALDYAVSGDEAAGKRAVEWALGRPTICDKWRWSTIGASRS